MDLTVYWDLNFYASINGSTDRTFKALWTDASFNVDGEGLVSATGAVPVIVVDPVISGSVILGEMLTTTNGVWSNSPSSYSYQWQRDGIDISGATSSNYTVVGDDVRAEITCDVVATNGSGSSTPATSNTLTNPLKGIFDIAANAKIFVYDQGLTDSVGSPVSAWTAIDDSCDLTQATSSKRPLRQSDGIQFDGIDDMLIGDSTATAFVNSDFTAFHGVSNVPTSNNTRQLWGAYADGISTIVRNCTHVNFSMGTSASLTRMRFLTADSSVAVQVALTSFYDGSGTSTYRFIARTEAPGLGDSETLTMADPPVLLDSAARPGTMTPQDICAVGAQRLTSATAGASFWKGKIQFLVFIDEALSDVNMDAVRDILDAAGYV